MNDLDVTEFAQKDVCQFLILVGLLISVKPFPVNVGANGPHWYYAQVKLNVNYQYKIGQKIFLHFYFPSLDCSRILPLQIPVTIFKIIQIEYMSHFDNEDLETFLAEAELVHDKVKALSTNQMSPQEFDKLQAARKQDLRKREQAKKRKQEEALEKKIQGREGKGITKDFANFCKFCHREYELPTPVCLRCKRDTLSLKERQEMLEVMVDDYKNKKKKREEQKRKWEMWQKTKSMLWKKTSNNYDKWQYFVSESEEEPEQEPIVPKNDPNFKALQNDMEERKKKRRKDNEQARRLKQKGNAEMKEGNYQRATELYTLALEHIKDMKSIYTNRALAYIKLKKFKKAINDCTNVIEYMEVFEKVGQNLDITFKAFSRRALAHKEKKDYKDGLQDIKKALQIYPHDNNAKILKKQIEGFMEHNEKINKIMKQAKENQEEEENFITEEEALEQERQIVKELAEKALKEEHNEENRESNQIQYQQLKQENKKQTKVKANQVNESDPISDIKERVEDLSQQNIQYLLKLFNKKEDLISIFIAAKGVNKCLSQLLEAQQSRKQGYLVSRCLKSDGVGQKDVWDFGVSKIHDRISQFLSATEQLNLSIYFIMEDMFEVLIGLSLHEKYRSLLNNSGEVHTFLEKTFSQLITKHKKQTQLFSSFLIYMGNLCHGESKLRDSFIDEKIFGIIVRSLFEKVITKNTFNRSYQYLKKNSFSLFSNLIRSQSHRTSFNKIFSEVEEGGEKPKWNKFVTEIKLYPEKNADFTEYMESLLSIFANCLFGCSVYIEEMAETLNNRFFSNPKKFSSQILNRAFLIVSRLKYKNASSFSLFNKSFSQNIQIFKAMKGEKNFMEHIVRILNIMYMPIEGSPQFAQPLPYSIFASILQFLSIDEKNQILFCNTANFFSVLLDIDFQYRKLIYQQLKKRIVQLIRISKDRIGNWRKNAAILLAKLSKNEECKEELKKNHGMDVLMSIAQFVK